MTTTPMPLIDTYIRASNETDVPGYLSCFTETATIMDEGESVNGHGAIADWFLEVQKKYNSTTELKSITRNADHVVMTAEVSGTFPGSPIKFDYHMDLSGELIQSLEIKFRK